MIIIDTKFSGLKLFKSNLYNDERGYLREIFKKKNFNKDLIFHYFAKSKKYVFRGFHFQSTIFTKYEGSEEFTSDIHCSFLI